MENNFDFQQNAPVANEQYTMSVTKDEYLEIYKLYTKTFKKSIFRFIAIIAVACIVFIPFETTISLCTLFLAILYSVVSLIKYKSLIKECKNKSTAVENRYQIIDIFDEKISISVIENNELTDKFTVMYDEITYLDENEAYFTFSDKVHLFYIKKESLKNKSILYEHFRRISDKLKNNIKANTIGSSLLLVTVNLGLLAMYSADEFATLFGNPCNWLYFLALPFALATVLYSIVLKKKKLKYIPNIIIGIMLSLSILANGLSVINFNKYYNSGYNVITETEKIIGIEIPTPSYIEFYKNTYYEEDNRIEIINEVYMELSEQEYVETDINYVEEIITADVWKKGLPAKFRNVIPYPNYFADSEYSVLYNVDTGEINTVPTESGKHRLAIIAYYYGTLDVVEFYITK